MTHGGRNCICGTGTGGQPALVNQKAASTPAWTDELIRFLQSQPGVAAVRVDPGERKVAVATLGEVDAAQLEQHLAEVLRALDTQHAPRAGRSGGFVVRTEGGAAQVERPTCATAPTFWQWRDFAWPEDEPEAPHEPEWRKLAVLAGLCGGLGLAGFAAARAGAPAWLATALYAGALLAGGWDAAIDTWENLQRRKLDIHFLMLAVAVGAVCIGAWGEAVLLLFLFSSSGAMEDYALDRTHREVSALLHSAPKHATLIAADGARREVPVEAVRAGHRLLVRPGEIFAADGVVESGRTACDESTLTGESVPVDKEPGAPVFSGTLNLWGAVEVAVRRPASESTLQKIIRLIQTAQKLRAPSERFTDRFGAGYTVAVLGLTAAMFLVWWLGADLPAFENRPGQTSAFYRAMTLLVVASPCALVLSIPSAILAAIAWGARHGVLFRGGAAIEKLADVGVVALDKTGTLTTGRLAVVGYESFPAGREREISELAYALESNSEHPLAHAIVRDAKARGLRLPRVQDFRNVVGQGVRGRVDGQEVLLGRRELLELGSLKDWAVNLPPASADLSEVWVVGRDVLGRVLLRDEIRAESRGVLAQLQAEGLHTVMLTGDRRHAAEAVAKELGVAEVRSHLTPEQKVAAVVELRRGGRKVAMVGDGVNDAPSLAAADVSVAMGARGSDAALEQAEVILMHDRIDNFLAALRLSRRAKAIIRQNLAISLGTVGVMVLASLGGWVPLSVGVLAHEGSTVVVCLNSLRLLAGRPGR